MGRNPPAKKELEDLSDEDVTAIDIKSRRILANEEHLNMTLHLAHTDESVGKAKDDGTYAEWRCKKRRKDDGPSFPRNEG